MADIAENGPPSEGRPLIPSMRRLLRVFAALAFVAGVLLFVLSEETDTFFSWTIEPPLTAAFLGASYWAACVLLFWSSTRRDWAQARAALPPVMVIAVMLLAATLIHLDRFHMDTIFGWFWLVAYVTVPLLLLIVLRRQLQGPEPRPRRSPLPRGLRPVLTLQSLVMVLVGASLFAAPETADALLPWMLTPLTARAIGAFVFGFGVAAAHASIENHLESFRGAALAYLVLGGLELVAVARYWSEIDNNGPGDSLYLIFLVSVVAVAVYALLAAPRSGSARAAASASSLS